MNDSKTVINQTEAALAAAGEAPSDTGNDKPHEPVQVPEWLGSKLKHLFTEVMSEPVPDDLQLLLKQLEEKERR